MHGAVREAQGREASMRSLTAATVEDVQSWLEGIKNERNDKGKLLFNTRQYVMVKQMSERVMQELAAEG